MKTLLIVYHSRTGGTAQMARACAEGARRESVHVRLMHAADTEADDVLTADGYIFAAPENLAALSGEMKEFFDRNYYAVLDRIAARPYALLVCGGSDGEGAARQATRIATGWRLRAIAEPIIVITHAQTPEAILAAKTIGADDLKRCAEVGQALAAGLAMGVF